MPLEYIVQSAFFYKSEYFVDNRVLIPRSETEILVEEAIQMINSRLEEVITICEVGVGSGAIGLSVLQDIPKKEVHFIGTDISSDAIDVFNINQFRHKFKIPPQHKIKTLLSDRLVDVSGKMDFIISNPPYIKESADRHLVHSQVEMFEPEVALFLPDDEYEKWFLTFFHQVKEHLKIGGTFMMEGHEDHLENLKKHAKTIFNSEVEIKNDYTQRPRFLILRNFNG